MDNFNLYTIKCLTNMHVGSGDATYSIIDSQVQRDVITKYPTINGSSLKGSLRFFLENNYAEKDNIEKINKIFGSDNGTGQYKIFSGMLLSMPARCNSWPFFRVTCPRIIKDLKNFISMFEDYKWLNSILDKLLVNINEGEILTTFDFQKIEDDTFLIEGFEVDKDKFNRIGNDDIKHIEDIFGSDLIILQDKTFNEIINDLPVIARNKLENGESQNLWYEEVVPRETRFYFGTSYPNEDLSELFNKITENIVQIGGNASIGYGYCQINKIVGGDN